MGRGPAEQRNRAGWAAQPCFATKGGKQEHPLRGIQGSPVGVHGLHAQARLGSPLPTRIPPQAHNSLCSIRRRMRRCSRRRPSRGTAIGRPATTNRINLFTCSSGANSLLRHSISYNFVMVHELGKCWEGLIGLRIFIFKSYSTALGEILGITLQTRL